MTVADENPISAAAVIAAGTALLRAAEFDNADELLRGDYVPTGADPEYIRGISELAGKLLGLEDTVAYALMLNLQADQEEEGK